MISYNVIIHKPPEPPVPHRNTPFLTGNKTYPDVKCQEDLDKFWSESPIQVGDYITYSPKGFINQNTLSSVYQIEETQTDFATMTTRAYSPYHPLLIKIVSLPSLHNTGKWDRWDDMRNLRKLSDEEFEKYVSPHLDRVRSNRQQQA